MQYLSRYLFDLRYRNTVKHLKKTTHIGYNSASFLITHTFIIWGDITEAILP